MTTQRIALLIVSGGLLVAVGLVVLGSGGVGGSTQRETQAGVASVVDGVQYIDITARGGYAPKVTRATANTASVLRVTTNNTYDCSSALVVPALGYREFLKPTGTVEIPIPADKAQGTLEGLCSMGMYHFSVVFE
jgi:plastocyanin domain-containing protein